MGRVSAALWAVVVVATAGRFRRPVRRVPFASLGRRRAPVAPLLSALVPPVFAWRVWSKRRRRQQQRSALVSALPDLVDLVAIGASAGYSLPQLVEAITPKVPAVFGDGFAAVRRDVERGVRYADALAERLPAACGDPIRPLVAALVHHDRYGTPLAAPLAVVAAEVRADRRRRAETAARRLPVKLLFPLVLCTLPAFALLTIVPLVLSSLGRLRG
ncbi:MAG: type II secretion system F family protein [Acidimicrobiia bacterium]